jgi:HSP20 family protein
VSNLERYNRSRRNLYNPVHPLSQIHSEINRTFERFFENPIWNESMPKMPAINMKDEGNQYVIEAEMPGLRDEDVEIEVHGGQLTIKGEQKQESKKEGEHMYIEERSYGSFYRTVTLPQDANLDHITADYENGLLIITIPKDPEKEPKRIKINRKPSS